MSSHCVSLFLVITIALSMARVSSSLVIRLIGGSKPTQGRLEISQTNIWGTFCGDGWTLENTQVVCRQLGFPGAVTFSSSTSPFSGASDMVVHPISDISCNGNESTLSFCNNTSNTCQRVLDVDVTCQVFGYAGCYIQSGVSTIPEFTNSLMTNDLCIERCIRVTSVAYAILQDTSCFCESSMSGFTRKDSDRPCSTNCPGNQAQSCGGQQVYTVFRTDVGFCVEPSIPYLGDFTLDSTRYGSIVEFRCDRDFELVGKKTLQCLGSSADALDWNGEYPICAEKRLVTLGLVLCSMGAIIVFLSMVFAVCGDIRRKMRKGNEEVNEELISVPTNQTQDIRSIHWNTQTNIVERGPPPVEVSVSPVAPSRQLQITRTPQTPRPPSISVGVRSANSHTSGEYAGLYEDLDDYVSPGEDIGGGIELMFERHPSEEESYERSTMAQSAAVGTYKQGEAANDCSSGQAEGNDGYLEVLSEKHDRSKQQEGNNLKVHSNQGEVNDGYLEVSSGQPEGNDGYLEVLPDEEKATGTRGNRPYTNLEITGEGKAPSNRHQTCQNVHDYTYIADISKVDIRPRVPLSLPENEQSDYDDTSVQEIYKNEGAMCPRPYRQDEK